MSDATVTFAVLGAVVALFVWNRLPVEVVVIAAGLALVAVGVLDVEQLAAGYGDPTVVFIATLFVVSGGLEHTGVTAWAGQALTSRVGGGRARLVAATMLFVAIVTALISVNGAVAALAPVVVAMAVRLRRSPSQLLIPVAFAAHAGSLLALTGTPVNVIVSDAAVEAGGAPFGFFEFGLVGVPLLVGTIAIVVLLGSRLLPEREAAHLPPDLSEHARTLLHHYELDGATLPGPVGADDRRTGLMTGDRGVSELIVPPRSRLVGTEVFPGMVTESGALMVLAVERRGERLGPRRSRIEVGDVLLVEGPWHALDATTDDPDVVVVDDPALVRRQAAGLGSDAWRALAVLAAMIALLTTGLVAPVVAGLLAAGGMVLLRVITVERAYRSVSWTTIVLVGGLLPVSVALEQSGAAGQLAGTLVGAVEGAGPYALLAGLFVLTAVLGQLISNTATVLVVVPIALSAAADLGVADRPVLMLVNVAAAASFLTPIATPANVMVYGPGGYRFGDYWRLGLPLMLWFGVVAVLLVPLLWPL